MSTAQITITEAGINEVNLLTILSVTTFREAYEASNNKENVDAYINQWLNEAQLAKELVDNGNLFIIVWCDGVPAGYAKMRTIIKPVELANNQPVEIERIYVLRNYYNKKIGAALMGYCIAYAQSRQHDIVWLGVWEHNHRALNFYRKWGFEPFSSHIFPFGDEGQTDILMKKKIERQQA